MYYYQHDIQTLIIHDATSNSAKSPPELEQFLDHDIQFIPHIVWCGSHVVEQELGTLSSNDEVIHVQIRTMSLLKGWSSFMNGEDEALFEYAFYEYAIIII